MNPEGQFQQIQSPGEDAFIVEGRWCVEALLDSGEFEVISVWRAEGSQEDFDEAYLHLTDVMVVSKSSLSDLLGYKFHRGIVALAKRPRAKPIADGVPGGLLVACPELADAANLGAIIRSAGALGAPGIMVPHRSGADPYSRKSIRASSGAVFRVPIFECRDLARDLSDLRDRGYLILGASLGEDCVSICDAPAIDDGVILFGPENGGLSKPWRDLCQVNLTIPMSEGIDSLT